MQPTNHPRIEIDGDLSSEGHQGSDMIQYRMTMVLDPTMTVLDIFIKTKQNKLRGFFVHENKTEQTTDSSPLNQTKQIKLIPPL